MCQLGQKAHTMVVHACLAPTHAQSTLSQASAVIQVILKWWLEKRVNRVMLLVWQQEGMQ